MKYKEIYASISKVYVKKEVVMKKYKVLKIVLAIVLLIGLGIIAVFPFANRDLTVVLDTNDGWNKTSVSGQDAIDGVPMTISFDSNDVYITEFSIYDSTGTIFIKEYAVEEFFNDVEMMDGAICELSEDRTIMHITSNNNVQLKMKPELQVLIGNNSKGYLYGRFVWAGLYACVIAIIYIAINAAKEKKEDSWNNHGPIQETKKFFGDLKQYWEYMFYAAKADLKAEVANSYLNRLWWLLEPFFNMLVYVIVFGKVMGNNIENYATFTFSSLLMWSFFSKTLNYSVKLVRNNRDIISKVYVPKFVILISNMILNFIKLMFSLIVLVVMLFVFRVQIGFNILWVIPAYVVMILFSFGISMICLHFGVYVDDLAYAIGILLNMMMFLSGIFYVVMTSLPDPLNTIMMCVNPMAMCIDTMRNALLYNLPTNLPILGMWALISLILCYIGVHIVYKNENSYVKII